MDCWHTLAQANGDGGGGLAGVAFLFIWLAIFVLIVAGFWKVFTKAGHAGWLAIIPIVNIYFLCKIAGRPGWWLVLYFIPLVNVVISVIVSVDIAKSFGRSVAFAIGLFFLPAIFYPILGFGSSEYRGPSAG